MKFKEYNETKYDKKIELVYVDGIKLPVEHIKQLEKNLLTLVDKQKNKISSLLSKSDKPFYFDIKSKRQKKKRK